MTRAVYLSSAGDPFTTEMVLNLWKRHWYAEIDIMYVAYNNHAEVPKEVSYEFLRKWEKEPFVRIIYTDHGIGNGNPITQMMLNSTEKLILLLEDDGFVFTPGVVDGWFSRIGEFDIVGSPRYAAGEIAEAARFKYKLDYSGVGDKGFGWWPNFFVCKREDLLKTDWDFGSKEYPKGTHFDELDTTMRTTEYTDTFTWASLQLRHMGLHFYDIPQNHAHPYDLIYQADKTNMFVNGDPQYIHGGSLSSGWGGYLNKKLPPVETDMQKQDIETRVAFWQLCNEKTDGYEEFKKSYREGIENLIQGCNLDTVRIQKKYDLYKRLMRL